jgi:hypothetical protein
MRLSPRQAAIIRQAARIWPFGSLVREGSPR